MIKVNSKRIISEITASTYRAHKKRNLLTIFAIVLTTFLITVVFAIGLSYWDTISLRQVRMNGMDYEISLSEPETSQIEIIRSMDEIRSAGISVKCGIIETYQNKQLGKVQLYWLDQTAWEYQCIPALEIVTGSYPDKQNEIMLSTTALDEMGIAEPEIGMPLHLEYFALAQDNQYQETTAEDFILSGYFRDYTGNQRGLVSEIFYTQTGAKQTDLTQGKLLISLKNPLYSEKDITAIQNAISLGKVQIIDADYNTISDFLKMITVLTGFLVMILMSGYLFIYNTLYISIAQDIQYYGQLKAIGMTSRQLRGIIIKTVTWNSLIGIPLGLILGLIISIGVVPQILHIMNPVLTTSAIGSAPPWVYILAAAFAFAVNLVSSQKPAKIAGDCSPVEAVRYTGKPGHRIVKRSKGSGVLAMARQNIFRDKTQALVIFFSFVITGALFLIINVIIKQNDAKSLLNAIYTFDIQFTNETTLDGMETLITTEKIDQIRELSGIKQVGVVSSAEAIVPYQENVYGEYYRNLYQSRWNPGGDYQEAIEDYRENPGASLFTSRFIGINDVEFGKLNAGLEHPLDEKEFKEGKIAVIDSSLSVEMGAVIGKSVNFSVPDSLSPDHIYNVSIAAITTDNPAYFSGGYTPVLIVSEEYAKQVMGEPYVELINVEYEEAFSTSIEKAVKNIFATESQITCESKLARYTEMKQTEIQVKILGGSIALIMALLTALNYFNMMAASVQNRAKEMAALESIGMTAGQIKKMLALEGIGYAIISMVISILVGIPLSYAIFQNMNIYGTIYSIPWFNNLLLFGVILVLCILTPVLIYQRTQSGSIITRLNQID